MRGEALIGLGRSVEGVAELEKAVAVVGGELFPSAVDARFALARALWPRPASRARALALARDARDSYQRLPDGQEKATEVAAWAGRARSGPFASLTGPLERGGWFFCAPGGSGVNISPMASTGAFPEAGLRGRLEQFGLATVLTFLDLERRSGELVVAADEKVGRLWLRQGRVVRARIEGSRRTNKSVVYDLLALERGRFSFIQQEVAEAADEMNAPTMLLLMEAARRFDEANVAPSP